MANSRLKKYKDLLTTELGFVPEVWATEGGARLKDKQSDNEQHQQAAEIPKFDALASAVGVKRWFYYHFCCPTFAEPPAKSEHDSALIDMKLTSPNRGDTCNTSP